MTTHKQSEQGCDECTITGGCGEHESQTLQKTMSRMTLAEAKNLLKTFYYNWKKNHGKKDLNYHSEAVDSLIKASALIAASEQGGKELTRDDLLKCEVREIKEEDLVFGARIIAKNSVYNNDPMDVVYVLAIRGGDMNNSMSRFQRLSTGDGYLPSSPAKSGKIVRVSELLHKFQNDRSMNYILENYFLILS